MSSVPDGDPPLAAPSAAEVEDRLLATLATELQVERARLPRLLRRIERLRRLLVAHRQGLQRCRVDLAHAQRAGGGNALVDPAPQRD